ncbi:MAG: electron transport protein SCO1/SenC [Polaromonas sp.]|jgi:protein SCO1/2|nr:electron transport protein SCO1/SenC [Polaromonas sp.]
MKTNLTLQPGRRRAAKRLAGVAALSIASGWLMGCAPDKPQFKSIDLTGADYAQGFSLADHNGQLRTLQDFSGRIVVVFFGFTQCPDVCPTSMAELAEVKQLLGPDADKLQAVFITLDPERDTPALLKAYMGNFDPGFLALRPEPGQLAQVARDFKIYYKKVDGKTPGSYSLDHSAGSYVFDQKGRIRLYNRYGSGAQMLASDIRLLLKSS